MAGQLVQFGLVMIVVMMGFAMSFFALFDDIGTYPETLLTLFKVMLGDTEFFDELKDEPLDRYETVATVLLSLYSVVFTIVLLNLLVAVLSTSHAQVQLNAERELNIARARMVQHYWQIVGADLLPAPFNLVQLVLSSPFLIFGGCNQNKAHRRAKRAIGQTVFWYIVSPTALTAGILLWVVSAPYSLFAAYREFSKRRQRSARLPLPVASSLSILQRLFWCLFGGPLCLLALWTFGSYSGRWGVDWRGVCGSTRPSPSSDERGVGSTISVNDVLREALRQGGVMTDGLHRFRDDPMSDLEMRHDEVNRAATVEHVELLRDRLEAEIKGHVDENTRATERKAREVKAEVHELSRNVSRKLEDLTRKLEDLSPILEALAMKDLPLRTHHNLAARSVD